MKTMDINKAKEIVNFKVDLTKDYKGKELEIFENHMTPIVYARAGGFIEGWDARGRKWRSWKKD